MNILNRWSGKIILTTDDANLRDADLRGADLQYANLRNADLQYADLRDADLRGAYLRDADLDFSALQFSCKTLGIKAGDRLVAQMFFHWARLDVSGCTAHIRYFHRIAIRLFGGYMTNLFCEYRNDISKMYFKE
ncbi:MAG: pentapeptide repeat-containing protein [Pseudomonadota bacterium]